MANQNWKLRAETMLSQFIQGDDMDNKHYSVHYGTSQTPLPPSKSTPYFYSRLENFSTSGQPPSQSCADYEFYDQFHCGCIGGGGEFNGRIEGAGSCISLLSTWVKVVFGRVIRAYLSSPLCLALVPLAFGLFLGFWMGRRTSFPSNDVDTTEKKNEDKNGCKRCWNSFVGFVVKTYHLLALHVCLVLVLLDPRQRIGIGCSPGDSGLFQDQRDERTRTELRSTESGRESGVDLQCVPRHIAVIMDGNRRYGKAKYGNATRGHWDGSKTLIEFAKWCIAEGVQILTVYAFSTENWDRDPAEVSALMSIFCKYCEEIRVEAINRGIRIHVLTTENDRIPEEVQLGIDKMVSQTENCENFTLNICLSYGGRGEIANACRMLAMDVKEGKLGVDQIGINELNQKMLTQHCCDPDIIIRTSGEERLSNFLLWQAAYSEFFFLTKQWPELLKADLLQVIRAYAQGRKRRYGK